MEQVALPSPFSLAFLSHLSIHAHNRYGTANPRNRVRRYRYMARSLFHLGATRSWLGFLTAHPELRRLYGAMPHLADKWHRHYLRADFSVERRLSILRDHYEFVLRQGAGGARLVDAMERELTFAVIEGKQGERFVLSADPDCGRTKEGEIVLKLMEGTTRLYTVAGSFVRDGERMVFSIGCLQGPRGENSAEVVKHATRAMHALRPREAMFYVVQVIAMLFGAEGIVGVGSTRHVYRGRRKTRGRIPAEYYDRLWEELGGERREDGDYTLPLEPVQRNIEDYASQKRAEARRRIALKEGIRAQITAFLKG